MESTSEAGQGNSPIQFSPVIPETTRIHLEEGGDTAQAVLLSTRKGLNLYGLRVLIGCVLALCAVRARCCGHS